MTSTIPFIPSGTVRRKRSAVPMGPPLSLNPLAEGDDAGSSGSSAIDSMRPVTAPRKRRKTFLDAFQSITLQKESDEEGEGCDDADSSQAVADDDYNDVGDADNYSTTSSIEDPDEQGSAIDRTLLSDREEAERKVMLELVFGPEHPESSSARGKDLVDLKLQELIRDSLKQAKSKEEIRQTTAGDDMTIDTPYSRASTLDVSSLSTGMTRSNSLPNLYLPGEDEQTMDTTSS